MAGPPLTHITGVSWLLQLWSVGSPPVLPDPLGSHAWDSIPVLAQDPQREVCEIQDSLYCLWPLPPGLRMAASTEAPHSSPLSPSALTDLYPVIAAESLWDLEDPFPLRWVGQDCDARLPSVSS